MTDGIQATSWFKSGKAYCIEDDLRRSVLAETGISTNGQRYSIGNVLFPALPRAHAPGQDLTALLKTPFRVQVQSDVAAVPEAQSFLLMLLGLTGVALAARRREN